MPDRQILEAMQERQIQELVTEIQQSPKYSTLEKKIAPIVAEKIHTTKGWEEKMRQITTFEIEVGNYVDLVECCESETGEHSHGYTTLRPHSGESYEQWRTQQEQRLEKLARTGLIQTNGNTKWKYEVTEIRDAQDKLQSRNTTQQKTSRFYDITNYGREKLQEHRVVKNAHS